MFFSPPDVFGRIQCPSEDACFLPNCLFLHETPAQILTSSRRADRGPWLKRRKLDGSPKEHDPSASIPTTLAAQAASAPLVDSLDGASRQHIPAESGPAGHKRFAPQSDAQSAPLSTSASASRASKSGGSPLEPSTTKSASQTLLRPKPLKFNPSGHGQRYLYLNKLHDLMKTLNDQARASEEKTIRNTAMGPDKLVNMAIDKEADIATGSPAVYPNVIKQQLLTYKKMSVEDWAKLIIDEAKPTTRQLTKPKVKREFDAELTDDLKRHLLKSMVCSQTGLEQYGYVTSQPTEEQVEKARKADEAMDGYEECARCGSRFQVYPDRRADGTLTGGGRCLYHWARPVYKKGSEAVYGCCDGRVGLSRGCTDSASHVFEVKNPERQAQVLNYACTPDNDAVPDQIALSIDCEMGFTTHGNELIRLTALWWPSGHVLLDTLVRPIGTVLDLNTRFSGVTAEVFNEAKAQMGSEENASVRMVDSPRRARQLLFEHIKPTTPLIGHAIENDLRALRVVHPTIVDTALLCPHPRGKLPMRRALRDLARQYLGRMIQLGGAEGHDSHEDAKATGDVVEEIVKIRWNEMRRNGSTTSDGRPVSLANKADTGIKVAKTSRTENRSKPSTGAREPTEGEHDGAEGALMHLTAHGEAVSI